MFYEAAKNTVYNLDQVVKAYVVKNEIHVRLVGYESADTIVFEDEAQARDKFRLFVDAMKEKGLIIALGPPEIGEQ